MSNNDMPIIQKVYDFYRDFYPVTFQMPKQDRHTIGAKIQELSLELLENLIGASNAEKKEKLQYLEKAATELDIIKTLIRLGEDVKAISQKRYLALSEILQEIGRMLGGWIRSLRY